MNRKYPIGGYAPGGYMNKCLDCGAVSTNSDKRATQCEVCALWAVNAAKDLEIAELRKDAIRLDYVLNKQAFLYVSTTDAGLSAYQLQTQDEDENYIVLSGNAFFSTPRKAIDAAIEAEEQAK